MTRMHIIFALRLVKDIASQDISLAHSGFVLQWCTLTWLLRYSISVLELMVP